MTSRNDPYWKAYEEATKDYTDAEKINWLTLELDFTRKEHLRVINLPDLDEAAASAAIVQYIASVARGNPIDPKKALEYVDKWQTYCGRLKQRIQEAKDENLNLCIRIKELEDGSDH